MLLFLLSFAVVQLAFGYACFVLSRRGAGGFFVAAVLGFLGFILVLPNLGSFFLYFQYLVLLLTALVCSLAKARSRGFLIGGALATLAMVVLVGISERASWARLEAMYPIQSLAPRLAYEQRAHDNDAAAPHAPLSEAALQRLDNVYDSHMGYRESRRASALRLLHASKVEQFVDSQGFGVGRGMGPAIWTIELPDDPPVQMPPALTPSDIDGTPVPGETAALPPAQGCGKPTLEGLHSESLTDFANQVGFGYVKDREHVVGFQSHRFGQRNSFSSHRWQNQRIELVSLLKHDRPMVYQSNHLPAMDELKNAPVRPLDAFEERGLTRLQGGRETYVESTASQIRMLGAVRAAKQCLACHNVDHGTLLGAFSYELGQPADHPAAPPTEDNPVDSAERPRVMR